MSRVIDTLSLTVMPPPSSGMLRSMPKSDLLTCVAAGDGRGSEVH